jgi:predicted DNA-binding transcriptional regulator YafY
VTPGRRPEERVLALAAYLHEHPRGVTRADIVEDVPGYGGGEEAVRRMLHRDLADLRDAFGIEVTFDERSQRYRLAPPFFTPAEREALVAAAALAAVEGLPTADPDPIGAAAGDDQVQVVLSVHPHVPVLRAAIARRRAVRFTYRGAAREVEPLALASAWGRWYLLGRQRPETVLRRFRLDRIEGGVVACGDERAFTVPDDLDAALSRAVDPNVWGEDPPVDAVVAVDRDHLDRFRREFAATITSHDPDRGEVTLTVRHRASLPVRLAAYRGHARLVAPVELVDEVRAWLLRLAGQP